MKVPFNSNIGPAWPDLGWVPAPRYLLRRDRILRQLTRTPGGKILDVGCGAGALLVEIAQRGQNAYGLEPSPEALRLARAIASTSDHPECIHLHSDVDASWNGHFDAVVAMEVLEHIEDDLAALGQWRRWLKPGGQLLVSVPAHRARWNASDEWAGHVRRYERAELHQKVAESSFSMDRLECYGFPLGNLLDLGMKRRYAGDIIRDKDGLIDRAANNDRSGIDRAPAMKAFRFIDTFPGRTAVRAAALAQAMFLSTELGTGFVLSARRL